MGAVFVLSVFPREARHYTPAPEPKNTGKQSLKSKKMLKTY